MTEAGSRVGHDSSKCGRNKRQGVGTCTRPAGWGTDHAGVGACKLHGGATPTHAVSAQKEVARREIEAAVDILGATPITDPLRALQQLAGEVVMWKDALAARVNLQMLRYESNISTEQIRGEVQLLERAMDRCNTVLATIAKLNIDERLARVDEATAVMIVRAIEAGLASAGVAGPAAVRARQVVQGHLKVLPGGGGR